MSKSGSFNFPAQNPHRISRVYIRSFGISFRIIFYAFGLLFQCIWDLGACYVVENLNRFEYLNERNEVIFEHIKMSS